MTCVAIWSYTMFMTTYKIVRNHFNENVPRKVIKTGLTLEEAQAHCRDPETTSSKCKGAEAKAYTEKFGPWFDGYDEE